MDAAGALFSEKMEHFALMMNSSQKVVELEGIIGIRKLISR